MTSDGDSRRRRMQFHTQRSGDLEHREAHSSTDFVTVSALVCEKTRASNTVIIRGRGAAVVKFDRLMPTLC